MKIFISFASEQAELAEALSLRLRERNHDVFFSSYNLPAGATYDYRIQSAINKSNLFIFLVSPQSISAGRYTLSELEFARANWPHPKGHVLPVVVSPTSVPHIPPYLKAVTLLQPSGDIVAETSAAVERVAQQLRRRRSRINVAMGILATVILCVGALLSYTYFPSFLLAMQTPKLCGDGVQRTDRGIVDGKPTEELAMYLDGLKNGKYAFNWGITGTEAAKQLGFSRRFATTYGEIIHRVETTRSAKIDEITAFVGSILDKERSIDKLAQQRDWRLPAIVYLRSYQVLECGFPTELMSNAPRGEGIFRQVKAAYPAFGFGEEGKEFAKIYDKALSSAREQINKNGSISVWEIPQYLRDAILKPS